MTPEQIEIYRRMTPGEKLRLAIRLNKAARDLKAKSLKALRPDWTDEQIKRKVRDLFLYARS